MIERCGLLAEVCLAQETEEPDPWRERLDPEGTVRVGAFLLANLRASGGGQKPDAIFLSDD